MLFHVSFSSALAGGFSKWNWVKNVESNGGDDGIACRQVFFMHSIISFLSALLFFLFHELMWYDGGYNVFCCFCFRFFSLLLCIFVWKLKKSGKRTWFLWSSRSLSVLTLGSYTFTTLTSIYFYQITLSVPTTS